MTTRSAERSNALSRRQFLQLGAMTAGASLLAACVAPGGSAPAAESGAAPAADSKVNVVVWYQDWDGSNRIMNKAKEDRAQSHPDVTIELTPIG